MRAEYKALNGKDADTSMLRKIQALAMKATADIALMPR